MTLKKNLPVSGKKWQDSMNDINPGPALHNVPAQHTVPCGVLESIKLQRSSNNTAINTPRARYSSMGILIIPWRIKDMEDRGLVRGEIPGRWLSVNVLGFAKARLRNRPADLKNTSRTIPQPQRRFHPSTQGIFFPTRWGHHPATLAVP